MRFAKNQISAALALAATLGVANLGCYGQFALTRKLYSWNGQATDSKAANSAITWGLIILPVYPVLGLVDFAVLNTIEFYSGKNPMADLKVGADGGLQVRRDGHDYRLRRIEGDRVEVVDEAGRIYRYHREGDLLVIEDAAGRPLVALAAPAERPLDATR